jgi:GrpB-like predicted nucleotidyltransferase (UPF0157 family)
VLEIQVLAGPRADDVAAAVRRLDQAGLAAARVAGRPGPAALVIAAPGDPRGPQDADVVLDDAGSMTAQLGALWAGRIQPFAQEMAGLARTRLGPAVLREHDPRWPAAARRMLGRLREGLRSAGVDDGRWAYDHIGSTAVPGLRAKPYLDLQIGVTALPGRGSAADEILAGAGFRPEAGSRPDSPGVYRDAIMDPGRAPAGAYRKRLYFRPDPGQYTIMHVRLLGAPWQVDTVAFRDWLRADPDGRTAYEQAKLSAARAHAGDADFDDYTRAKGSFFRSAAWPRDHLPRESAEAGPAG